MYQLLNSDDGTAAALKVVTELLSMFTKQTVNAQSIRKI